METIIIISVLSTLGVVALGTAIVVAFRMLPSLVWRIPTLGTFNLHASLLPQYRGAAPINWAVINGEKESGVTTFLIDDKIDTGNILLQEKVVLAEGETAGSLHDKLQELGAALVLKTVHGLAEGNIKAQLQNESSILRNAPKIFREDCRIDWTLSGEKIESFIRGMSPYPAAFATVKSDEVNGEIKITSAEFFAEGETSVAPVLKIVGKQLLVLLPDGALELKYLKPQGKRAMPASDFINGIHNKSQEFNIS